MRPLAFAGILGATLLFGCAPSAPELGTVSAPGAKASTPSTGAAAVTREEPKTRIVDPTNRGWPRKVQAVNGIVEIKAKPQRIHTLSLGLDEITLPLVGPGRVIAIHSPALDPVTSNVVALAQRVPHHLPTGRDAEQIVAVQPDLVVAGMFTRPELLQQIEAAGIPLVVTDLEGSVEDQEANIRFLAYLYGEEAKGERLSAMVKERLERIARVVERKTPQERPRALVIVGRNFVPGRNSNVDVILRRAGAINVAAEAGVERWQQIGLEAVVELRPDVIVLHETDVVNPGLSREVLSHPALQVVPALKSGRVYQVPSRYLNTLSHWNVRGVEELAKRFYPQDFQGVVFSDFE